MHHEETKDAPADAIANALKLDIAPLLASNDVVLVKLVLRSGTGQIVSQNLYWLAESSPDYRALDRLAPAQLSTSAASSAKGDTTMVRVELKNTGNDLVLQTKLTLVNASDRSRILPAYYSDNYVSLLPGESREIEIEYPSSASKSAPELAIRGWNVRAGKISVGAGK